MEAKDTIMDNLSEAVLKHTDLPMGQAIAIEQAEISFKAGIKEVVEWVKANSVFMSFLADQEWQTKLKEWGIE